jgi:hypothetical protein
MKLFKEAQDQLLASAPAHFTFDQPPLLGWRAKFGFSLPAAVFVHYYQMILGRVVATKTSIETGTIVPFPAAADAGAVT